MIELLSKEVEGISKSIKRLLVLMYLDLLMSKNIIRGILCKKVIQIIREKVFTEYQESKYIGSVVSQFIINLYNQILKNYDRGIVSKSYLKRSAEIFLKDWLAGVSPRAEAKKKYIEKYGIEPPGFFTISPTQKCNLKCIGCYAESHSGKWSSLPYWVVERAIREMHDIAGSIFVVVSGGEPYLWNEDGKDIISIAEKFNDMYFLVYTNGLFLYGDRVKRISELGNMTPAISIEGYEKETDERRGKGVFNTFRKNIEELKKFGIPFGISVTATKKNINILLDDKFYEYWFDEVGATYMWMFHLMPIGRARETMELMISPEERVELLKEWEHLLFDRGYFVGDFWNAGVGSRGCIAYGRPGGYFYLDWDGKIMPCVFVPYYKDNIFDLYKNGKTIVDALMSDLFKRGRKWQQEYGYNKENPGNFFAPCSIRDHYVNFRKNILSNEIKPENENAKEALLDSEYYEKMLEFDEKLRGLTEPLWNERMKY